MKSLIWKEWREQRLFFFLAIGLILLTAVTLFSLPEDKMRDYGDLLTIALFIILPILFSLFLGTISFTNEFTRNTKSFLLSHPVTSKRLFWTKFFSGLVLLLVLFFLTLCAFFVVSLKEGLISNILRWEDQFLFILFPLSMILLYSAACFSSLLLKNTLPAILCTPFILLFYILCVLPLLPLLGILSLTAYSWALFSFLTFPVLMILSLIFNFLTWQKSIVKDLPPAKTILTASGTISLFSLGLLLTLPLYVVIFLISPSLTVFYLLIIFTLMLTSFILGLLIWHRIAVKRLSPIKSMFTTIGIIFLFSFGIHAIARLTASYNLNKAIQQARAEGIRLTMEEIIPPPVSDKDNAAIVYQQAFELLDKLRDKYKEGWKYMPYDSTIKLEEITTEQKRTISRIMRDPEFIELYTLIEKAVNMPACRFALKYEKGPEMLLPHLAKMRALARLIAARTYILSHEGKYSESLKSVKTGLLFANSLNNEPIIISQLARIAIDIIEIQSVNNLIDTNGAVFYIDDYNKLVSIVNEKDRFIAGSMEGELALWGGYVFNHPVPLNQLFILTPDGGQQGGSILRFLNIIGVYLSSPVLKEDYAFYINTLSEQINYSKKPYFLVKDQIAELDRKIFPEEKFKGIKHIVSAMVLPALGRIPEQQAKYNAALDTFKLALALKIYRENHGNYPDTLYPLAPEVIPELPLDPFTGKDYIYRKEGKGFFVYSVGQNEKDDGGHDREQSPNYDDISFKVTN